VKFAGMRKLRKIVQLAPIYIFAQIVGKIGGRLIYQVYGKRVSRKSSYGTKKCRVGAFLLVYRIYVIPLKKFSIIAPP
jgi:hypothetical protein